MCLIFSSMSIATLKIDQAHPSTFKLIFPSLIIITIDFVIYKFTFFNHTTLLNDERESFIPFN